VNGVTQQTTGQINLGPLANHGGHTQTMALMLPSSAIDFGDTAACAAAPVSNLDQRGLARPYDGDANGSINCDVGAFEYCPDADADLRCTPFDNCPNWANAAQNLPIWPVPANDPDCDGWNNAREIHVGTDPTKHCNDNTGVNNEPDAWPGDFNDDRITNLPDVISFGPTFNKLPNDDGYNQRYDLNMTNQVLLSDVVTLGPFFNRMCS
jgi:hypothetical protein